ncbi:glycoside hydrolase [Hanseniaspora valbyensis NRRL Y-1626]|uniref:glucan 1,3-beta-glucosidase n=1 Tax=Hanseniaspora valbyensis NRRL Y-1626 TaxID=766949 RepID=A0A1B7TGS0_9ASCO|nr:glycoside hydrolase [Hanseniaspora valbyensis NRRL Y-1626]
MILPTLISLASFVQYISLSSAVGSLGINVASADLDGNCRTTEEWEEALTKASAFSSTIKTYAVSDCNMLENIAPALNSNGNMKVWLGIWEVDDTHYQEEKDALSTYLPSISKDYISGVSVGSEALYRGDLTPAALAAKISDIKSLLADITDKDGNSYSETMVGTVDSWNIWVNSTNSDVITAADYIMVNAFPFWQYQTASNQSHSLVDDVMQAIQTIQTVKGTDDFYIAIGETGSPTGGTALTEGQAPLTVANAEALFQEGICTLLGYGIDVNLFELQDEPTKPLATADDGTSSDVERHWGVYDSDYNLKYSLTCDY